MELIDRVTKLLELEKIPFNLYIDISKAFDVLNHDILLLYMYIKINFTVS